MELLPPDLVSVHWTGDTPQDRHWFVEMYGTPYAMSWPEVERLTALARAEDPTYWDEARRLWREKSDAGARSMATLYHF